MKELTREQFKKIKEETSKIGGCTFENFEVVHYSSGYQVATTNKTIEAVTDSQLFEALKATDGNGGTWVNNGVVYVDKSYFESDLQKALIAGKKYNQISIWNWSAMDEIKVK